MRCPGDPRETEDAMGWLRTLFGTRKGIGPREADGLMRSGALLLDVREPAEWRAGHAPGARHIPLGELEGRLGELPRDQTLVVVCRSGGRSARATSVLTRSGFQALNLNGGMGAWASVGLTVQTDDGEAGTVV
jgi:rhodanese-related sulfurtransferase